MATQLSNTIVQGIEEVKKPMKKERVDVLSFSKQHGGKK